MMFDPEHPKTQEDLIKEYGLDTPGGILFLLLLQLAFGRKSTKCRDCGADMRKEEMNGKHCTS